MGEGAQPPGPSWAKIARTANRCPHVGSVVDPETLEKLKASITDSVQVDNESSNRARMRFQHALYGKLFGMTPPFDFVKNTLLRLWSSFGVVHISDMPNGYFLIRCSSDEVKQKVMFGGP